MSSLLSSGIIPQRGGDRLRLIASREKFQLISGVDDNIWTTQNPRAMAVRDARCLLWRVWDPAGVSYHLPPHWWAGYNSAYYSTIGQHTLSRHRDEKKTIFRRASGDFYFWLGLYKRGSGETTLNIDQLDLTVEILCVHTVSWIPSRDTATLSICN